MIKNLPPQNIEAEYAVISSAIINRNSLEKVMEYGQHIYYMPNSKTAWKILKQLYGMELEPSLLLFKDIATKQENLPEEYIHEIAFGEVTVTVESLLKDISTRYKEREVIRLTAVIQEKAYDRQDINPEIKAIMELEQQQNGCSVEVINMLDLLEVPLMEFIENREYMPTGIRGLDDRIRGTEPGQLIVIAAQPGGGKTTLALQIISKSPEGLFISLEESRDNLFTKLLAMESNVNLNNFKYGKFTESHLKDISDAKVRIKEYFSSTVMIGNMDLIHIIIAIRKHTRNTKCRVVAVENVGLIVGGKGKDLTEQYNYIARTFKMLAKELNISIYLLSQQNKASYSGEPTKADLNYLTANDPDFVWFCWDDSIIIAKGRTTRTGRISDIVFRAEVSRFDTVGYKKFDEGVKA